MSICERVFELAKQQKKTQGDIADACNVRQATVSAWKAKNAIPSAAFIAPLAELFGVSCDYLCTGKEFDAPASVRQGIFGNKNHDNAVIIGGDGGMVLSEIESELVRVCGVIDIRRKNALLNFAYELEKEMK
jgi:transcriptional regulator with XRE-family HTH domain